MKKGKAVHYSCYGEQNLTVHCGRYSTTDVMHTQHFDKVTCKACLNRLIKTGETSDYINFYKKTFETDTIPDKDVFSCEIQTPQFLTGNRFYMQKQKGRFDKNTLLFSPFTVNNPGGHYVQFNSLESFQDSLIKLL